VRTYAQLTCEQRYQIYALLKAGHNQSEIAYLIRVHKSTISRELRRNRGLKGYRPKQAHQFALNRRKKAWHRIEASAWILIESLIRQEWSPEQVSEWLRENYGRQISHEWIYQYILTDKQAGGDLHRHLRCQKKRRKRYGSYDRRGTLKNRVSIDQRPAVVDTRRRLGDWEVDTIIGKGHRHAIVSLTERKSRLALLRKVERKTAQAVADAVIELLKPLSIRTHTITADNGKEFGDHERIARDLRADVYFAHPYSSWERASNENMNGLIRQYFPKKRSFATISEEEIEFAMERLNNRPRKCLGFKSPNQVFFNRSSRLTGSFIRCCTSELNPGYFLCGIYEKIPLGISFLDSFI
jgi:IS30 family transposase